MPPRPLPNNFQQELNLLMTAADEFHNSDLPEPTTAAGKRTLPDNNKEDSNAGDEEIEPDDENEAGFENYTPSEKQLFIRRIAKRLKLNNAQTADVEKFSKETIGAKLVVLYSETISLSAKVNKLAESVGPAGFVLTKATTENIKYLVRQTFFDPAVKVYKTEDMIKAIVTEKIRRTLNGIPKDLEQTNPHAWKQIVLKVSYEATQLRGAVKKVLKEDSTLDPTKQMNLSALTKAVTARAFEGDAHKFGIETYMRVALFRKVYLKHPGEDFWDNVDDWLAGMLGEGKVAYEKAMTGLVAVDRRTYGGRDAGDVVQ